MSLISLPGFTVIKGIDVVITASRSSGVSPCTVMFTCRNTTFTGYNEHEVIGTDGTNNVGYYFDFGDPASGTFNTYHATSKNISVGGFMAMHTFEPADGTGTTVYTVKVNAKTASGETASASTTISVQAQDDYYSAANTIAVSNTLGATGWDALGNDRNPPTGYTEDVSVATIPSATTSAGNVFWPDIQGKRIMLYRGDDFSAEGPIYIRSGNDNFHVTWFGDELSGTVITESGSTISFAAPATGPQLAFDAGTAEFVVGEVVTGSSSGHQGTIRTIVRVSGTWGSNANGQMDLTGATGIFQDDEALTGDISGAATANGTTTTVNADKNDSIGGTITDSANGLGSLTVGAQIDITGAAGNNTSWTVRTVSAGEVTVRYDKGVVMTTESANGAAVITEHNLLPELNLVKIGSNDATATTNQTMTDAELSANQTQFSNDGFCENGYFDGIKLAGMSNGISYRHMTFHRIDCDRSGESASNKNQGTFDAGQMKYAWKNPLTLDPDSVPFPYGYYISDSVIIGSPLEIIANDLPTMNISSVSSLVSWYGVCGTVLRAAAEHNMRTQGWRDCLIHDCDFLGQHIGGSGNKLRAALRGGGMNQAGEITTSTRCDDYAADDTNNQLYPIAQYQLTQYLYDSAADIGGSTSSGWDNAQSSGDQNTALTMDLLAVHNTIDNTATNTPNTQWILKGVKWACATSFTNLSGGGISDASNNGTNYPVLDDGPDNVVINGVISTETDWLGPTYFDEFGSTDYVLPVPDAPS